MLYRMNAINDSLKKKRGRAGTGPEDERGICKTGKL